MAHQRSIDPGTIDDLHNLLANRHRRATLAYFRESSTDVASVTDLAAEISDPDHGGEQQTAIQLRHCALPRLDAADVVDYDARTNTVRYRGHPDLDLLKESVASL